MAMIHLGAFLYNGLFTQTIINDQGSYCFKTYFGH